MARGALTRIGAGANVKRKTGTISVNYPSFLNRDYKSSPRRPGPDRRVIITAVAALVAGFLLLGLVTGSSDPAEASAQAAAPPQRADEATRRVYIPLRLPGQETGERSSDARPVAVPRPGTARTGPASGHPATRSVSRAEPAAAPKPDAGAWLEHRVRPGDSLSAIFSELEIHSHLRPILALKGAGKALRAIYPGQLIRVRKQNGQFRELVYEPDDRHQLRVVRDGDHYRLQQVEKPVEVRRRLASGVIRDSLFVDGRRAGLSDGVIMELAGIFGWDIDFALDLRKGDRFTLIYEELYRDGEKIGDGHIVAAEFSNQGRDYQAVRYTRPDGVTDYYSPDGRSMRKAFLRTPVNFTHISSRFSLRRKHPILNRIRAHKGVDYAAPRGTPVKAAGDGKVIFKGRKGGYGRVIILKHGARYSTLYAHLNAYSRRIRVGSRVKQGQVIGFVGMSGLATGPHLHYEFRVNGVHRNPLTVKLPAAQPLPAKYMADFKAHAQPLLSQIRLYRRTTVAEATRPDQG